MAEHHKSPLATRPVFFARLARNAAWGFILILIGLAIGMVGYHHFEKLSWVDAYANASMILSGMGELTELKTEGGKIFAGTYALFSGLMFIVVVGLFFAPVVHRFLHKFHMETGKEKSD